MTASIADKISALKAQYDLGTLSLNALVLRSEAVLEEGVSLMSADTVQRALNCIYVVEENNAFALEEKRPLHDQERSCVRRELEYLTSVLFGT